MNTKPNNTRSETTTHSPDPTPPKPRFNATQFPLVKVFKLVKRLARNGDLTLAEARALHGAIYELDSVGQFALHVPHRVNNGTAKANLDELYSEYRQFCASKAWQPHPQWRFERLLRLEGSRKAPECADGRVGMTATGT
jgi:hypothetical protein